MALLRIKQEQRIEHMAPKIDSYAYSNTCFLHYCTVERSDPALFSGVVLPVHARRFSGSDESTTMRTTVTCPMFIVTSPPKKLAIVKMPTCIRTR